jgi:hypothetical protein
MAEPSAEHVTKSMRRRLQNMGQSIPHVLRLLHSLDKERAFASEQASLMKILYTSQFEELLECHKTIEDLKSEVADLKKRLAVAEKERLEDMFIWLTSSKN